MVSPEQREDEFKRVQALIFNQLRSVAQIVSEGEPDNVELDQIATAQALRALELPPNLFRVAYPKTDAPDQP